MKAKRIGLVLVFLLITVICYGFMNNRYDSLARYPYKELTTAEKNTIKVYLNDSEIEYIIDYAIAPYTFLPYIKEQGFNIYFSNIYSTIHSRFATNNALQVVEISNFFTNRQYGIEDISNLLSVYSYDELIYYIKNFFDKNIEQYPQLLDLTFSENNTFANYQPKQIQNVSNYFNQEENFYLRDEAAQDLEKMCAVLTQETGTECGGLKIKYALLSFDQIQEIYNSLRETGASEEEMKLFIPGSNAYQLGVIVQFEDTGRIAFDDTIAGKWLKEHAYEYGFIQEFPVLEEGFSLPEYYHYYGLDIAARIHEMAEVNEEGNQPNE